MRALLAASLAASIRLASAQEPEYFHDSKPERWGKPVRIVQPEYPTGARERRITGHVDFEGLVDAEGRLRDIEYRAGSPEAEALVAAVREVAPHWVFYPAIGKDCMPEPRRYTTRVWFELEGEEPRIKITRRVDDKVLPPDPSWTLVKRVHPTYPRDLLRRGEGGLVYARIDIAPDGSVREVDARQYPRDHTLEAFARNAQSALKLWHYTPLPAGEARPRVACMEITYKLGP